MRAYVEDVPQWRDGKYTQVQAIDADLQELLFVASS